MGALGKAVWDLTLRAVDDDYPLLVHVPHSLISICRYRQWREEEKSEPRQFGEEEKCEPRQWLYDMFASCFTHSQGGDVSANMLLEGEFPLHGFARSADYVHVQVLSYLLNYWSPGDCVYRTLATPRHPVRLFCVAFDAFDIVAGLCGLVDTSRKKFPRNKLLPFMVSGVLFQAESFFRYLDRRARGKQVKSFLAEPGSDMTRATSLALLYWYFGYGFQNGRFRNRAVVAICLLYTALEVVEDVCDVDGFEYVHKPVLSLLIALRKILHLGPAKCRKSISNPQAL